MQFYSVFFFVGYKELPGYDARLSHLYAGTHVPVFFTSVSSQDYDL
jgi:hypothetical protein